MRYITTIRATIEVNVDVEFEFDNRFGQAVIVSSRVSPNNDVSPRKLQAAMRPGDFSELDKVAKSSIQRDFLDKCQAYQKKHYTEFPDKAIRSAPFPAPTWESLIRTAQGMYCMIPVSMVTSALKGLSILFEPVMSRVPTVYIWNADINVNEFDQIAEKKELMNNPQMHINTDEGCLCLQWKIE
jgi:hypothetical protein